VKRGELDTSMELVDTANIDFVMQQKLSSSNRLLFIHYQSTTTSSSSAVVAAKENHTRTTQILPHSSLSPVAVVEWRERLDKNRRMKKNNHPILLTGKNKMKNNPMNYWQ